MILGDCKYCKGLVDDKITWELVRMGLWDSRKGFGGMGCGVVVGGLWTRMFRGLLCLR